MGSEMPQKTLRVSEIRDLLQLLIAEVAEEKGPVARSLQNIKVSYSNFKTENEKGSVNEKNA